IMAIYCFLSNNCAVVDKKAGFYPLRCYLVAKKIITSYDLMRNGKISCWQTIQTIESNCQVCICLYASVL
ncbi:MAG: hypothetical protein ACOCNR_04500, partial [Prevotella pectinovora]